MFKSDYFHLINPSLRHQNLVRHLIQHYSIPNYYWVRRKLHPTHLETLLEWAFKEGFRKIIIWGGDGSLSRTIQWLYEANHLSEVILGVVPAGTCNDVVRYFGWPSLKKCVERFKSLDCHKGSDRSLPAEIPIIEPTKILDVGVVKNKNQQRIFINNCGFGRTPAAAEKAGKSNLVKDILNLSCKRITLEWHTPQGHRFETMMGLMMIVCNAPYFNGGLYFSNQINMEDAILNGFIVQPGPRWKLIRSLVLGRVGFSLMNQSIRQIVGSSLYVQLDDSVVIQCDGEVAFKQPATEFSFHVEPAAMRLIDFSEGRKSL